MPNTALLDVIQEREFFIDNLLVRIHSIIEMTWTGLAPWEFEFPFPCSQISTFLCGVPNTALLDVIQAVIGGHVIKTRMEGCRVGCDLVQEVESLHRPVQRLFVGFSALA